MLKSELLNKLGLRPSRIGLVDGVIDVSLGILRRPGRTVLTVVGTIIGVGAFVATLGASTTISRQVSDDFDLLRASEVVIQSVPSGDETSSPFPDDAEQRLARLNGVISAGVIWSPEEQIPVTVEPLALKPRQMSLVVASPGALTAIEPTLATGRLYDAFHASSDEPVALLGRSAADALGITRIDNHPAIFVNGLSLTILGIIEDTKRRPGVLSAVVAPPNVAKLLIKSGDNQEVLIHVAPGAAQLIATQAPLALRPDQPERLRSVAPPDPRRLRQTIETRLNTLLYTVAGIALVVGAIGIANTTLVSVLERTQEFGLRRAFGARPRHIITHVVGEAAALGAIGGAIGASLGLLVLTAIAITQQWTLTIEPAVLPAGPLIGALTGAIAGTLPANRARHIEPAEALRR